MTQRNKLIVLIAYLLVLSVCLVAYRSNRAAKVKRLRADLAKIGADQTKVRANENEVNRLTRLIPADANIPAYIENLYRTAREAGLTQCEVTTEADKGSGAARPGGSETSNIAKHRLKLTASGTYRHFAELLRLVQNSERFNRIIDFKLVPEGAPLKGFMTVELYSLPVKR